MGSLEANASLRMDLKDLVCSSSNDLIHFGGESFDPIVLEGGDLGKLINMSLGC